MSAPSRSGAGGRAAIDPRLRARRVAVAREAGRRRLRILLAALSTVCLAGLAWLAVQSPLLDVDRVSVRGTEHLSPAEVRRAAGVERRDALLLVDRGAVARRVEQLPWAADVSVGRRLPGTLVIDVTERRPVAWVHADGRVLARVPEPPSGLAELQGVGDVPEPGRSVGRAAAVLRAVGDLPAGLRAEVASARTEGGRSVVRFREGPGAPPVGEIRLGGLDDLPAKVAAAVAVVGKLDGRVAYLDVSVPQAPVTG